MYMSPYTYTYIHMCIHARYMPFDNLLRGRANKDAGQVEGRCDYVQGQCEVPNLWGASWVPLGAFWLPPWCLLMIWWYNHVIIWYKNVMIWCHVIWGYDDMMRWWYDDMMTWWHDDVMIWFYDDMMLSWYADLLIWAPGCLLGASWVPPGCLLRIWWCDDVMMWWYDDIFPQFGLPIRGSNCVPKQPVASRGLQGPRVPRGMWSFWNP